jgi:hypothetical protein
MFSRLRKRVTFPNVVLTLVLVFAMTGGAYAAKKILITSTSQISPSVLKKLKGNRGPAGKAGATGPQGPAGPAGPAGAGSKGEPGTAGTNGTDGANGASVTSKAFNGKVGSCNAGGSEFSSASGTTYACNGAEGKEGEEGPEGSPWTAGGTLPSGKSEKGSWGAAGQPYPVVKGVVEAVVASISFTVPLSAAPEKVTVITAGKEGEGGGCPIGSKVSKPEAEPGNLCVFVSEADNVLNSYITKPDEGVLGGGNGSASTMGAVVVSLAETHEEPVLAFGTWAVTAK